MSRTFNAHTTKIKNAVTGAWDTPVTVKGKSAYEAAVEAGLFSGTEEEYNNFIKNQRESSIQAVRDEGTRQVSNVQAAAEEIAGNIEQTQQNTQDIAELKSDLSAKIDKPSTAPAVGKILKVTAVNEDGSFVCEWADAPSGGGAVNDVLLNNASLVQDGVVNLPILGVGGAIYGFTRVNPNYGIKAQGNGVLFISPAVLNDFKNRITDVNNGPQYRPIVPNNLDDAIKFAMCDGKGATWTDAERIAALLRMGCTVDDNGFVKWTAQEGAE